MPVIARCAKRAVTFQLDQPAGSQSGILAPSEFNATPRIDSSPADVS